MMIIRKVEMNDLEALLKLENLCFPKEEAATEKSFIYRIQTFPESFYIALKDDKIVGFINGCVTDNMVISDNLFEPNGGHNPQGENQAVFGLVVDPDYQNRGIAASLMDHLMQSARTLGRKNMILTCKQHLIKYYEGFGYVNQGVSQSTHGGAVWYDMVAKLRMQK